MSILENFDNAHPILGIAHPVVLNFKPLHPNDLGKFAMHDNRIGGDLSHVDLDASDLNRGLLGGPQWKAEIKSEVRQASLNNLDENVRALKAKSRKKEAAEVEKTGTVDPWRRTKGGPLREGILTVNKAWFGGTGHDGWDPEKVAEFTEAAMDFLKKHFSDGQLRFASAHADEEAFHIHFVVMVWQDRFTANRGHQSLLKASDNSLLASYEHAQDLAGEAFLDLGIVRGERRAEMRRIAKAADTPVPERRTHVPPSKWRQKQIEQGRTVAQQIIARANEQVDLILKSARALSTSAILKSRNHAVRDAKKSEARMTRKMAEAECERDILARKIGQMQKDVLVIGQAMTHAEAKLSRILQDEVAVVGAVATVQNELQTVEALKANALERFGQIEREISLAEAGRDRVEQHVQNAKKRLSELTMKVAELDRKTQVANEDLKLILQISAREKDNAETAQRAVYQADARKFTVEAELVASVMKRRAEEDRLASVQVSLVTARKEQSKAEAIAAALIEGLQLFTTEKIFWHFNGPGREPKLIWSDAALSDKTLRKALELRIAPALSMLTQLAGIVSTAVQTLLASERQKLEKDAAFVAELRDDWDIEQRSRLLRIETSADRSDPGVA